MSFLTLSETPADSTSARCGGSFAFGLGVAGVVAAVCAGVLSLGLPGVVGEASAQPLRPGLVGPPDAPIERWEVVGDGAIDIVMIPGLACDGTVFNDFMQARSRLYRFHALTLPGMAGTTPPAGADQMNFAGTPWIDNAIQAIAHHITEQRIDRPLIMGHAMGGTIAIRFALDHPELVSGVVTLDGFPAVPLFQEVTPETREQVIMQSVAGTLLQQSAEDWYRSTDAMATMFTLNEVRNQELAAMFRTTAHPIARRYMIEFYKTDPGARLGESEIPMLAVASIDSQTAAIADRRGGIEARRERWRNAMAPVRNGMLAFAEDCKHFLFDECPEDIDEAMNRFLLEHDLVPAEAAQPNAPAAPGRLEPAEPGDDGGETPRE